MFKSKLGLLGASMLMGSGLIAAGPAEAYNIRLGNVGIQIDSSLSVGASWKMKDTNTNHLAIANGGNPDMRPVVSLLAAAGGLANGQTPAEAVAANTYGTASNVGSECSAYTAICLNLGSSEAGALNNLFNAGVSAVARAATVGNQKAKDAAAKAAVEDIDPLSYTAAGPTNYDASINGDDGRQNFEKGDMFSQSNKFITELEARSGNVRAFMRINGFYDSVLDDDDAMERSNGILDSARDEAVADLQVLDAFVDYDTDIAGVPVLIRVGKQVINWGESTFFLGGNSVFNPIDVPAIRRPGAEIKDALLPVSAAYISASLTDDLSLEAYFGDHDGYRLDVGGTHFANSDNLVPGSGLGGNNGIFLVSGGRDSGSNKWNLDDAGIDAVADNMGILRGTQRLQTALRAHATHPAADRDSDHPQHYSNLSPIGELETFRTQWEDTNIIENLGEEKADGDNMGLALRYYAENLNSTEFGFYYQKYTSRIPYVAYKSRRPNIGVGTVSNNTSATTASLSGRSACSRAAFGTGDPGSQTAAFTTDLSDSLTIGNSASDDFTDKHGTWEVIKAAGQASYTALAAENVHRHYHTQAAAVIAGVLQTEDGGGLDPVTAGIVSKQLATITASRDTAVFTALGGVGGATGEALTGALSKADHDTETAGAVNSLGLSATAAGILALAEKGEVITKAQLADFTNVADEETGNRPWEIADFTDETISGQTWLAGSQISSPTGNTYTDLLDAQCLIGIDNAAGDGATDADWYGDYAFSGSTQASINYDADFFTYFPEDIEVYGASFSTTAFGWGIQGEVTYRPDMPLLIDTDTIFIAAVSDQCAFPLSGDAGVAVYAPLVTLGTVCDATVGGDTIYGHTDQDVFNWDIGTTATFTRSNPIVSFLKADLAVVLTEFGGVSVPDIETTYAGPKGVDQIARLQGICTAGSDLPLGSLLDLDGVAVNSCRPTENSSGALLLTSLQYNNVFGTPWGLSPTLIVREGLDGYSPTPAGSFREGVGSTSLSVRADYQGYLSVSVSYTDFTGDEKYSKTEDQDFASLSVNYAF